MENPLSTDPELNRMPTDQDLARLQFTTLLYYLHCTNPDNGLVRDKTQPDAPASDQTNVNGVDREFFDYIARGAPYGPDDGTVSPWVVVASLPFAPEIVIPTLWNFARMNLGMTRLYGFKPSFNQSFPMDAGQTGRWVSPYHGIDQGPVVLMTENYRTGLSWNIMRRCKPLVGRIRRWMAVTHVT